MAFTRYIAAQSLRTPGVMTRAVEAFDGLPSVSGGATWGLVRTIFATNVACAFFSNRKRLRFVFLDSRAGAEFITGDQPIVNMHADPTSNEAAPTELEFHYPVTPRRAILISIQATASTETRVLDEQAVAGFNSMIAASSNQQLYASREDSLLTMIARRNV